MEKKVNDMLAKEQLRLKCIEFVLIRKDLNIHDFGGLTRKRNGWDRIPYPTIVAEHIRHYVETGETKFNNSFLSFLDGYTLVEEGYLTRMQNKVKELEKENKLLKAKGLKGFFMRLRPKTR